MTETRALILVFIGMTMLAGIAGVVLALAGADGVVYGLVIVFLTALGGLVSAEVVMHYGSLKERREREEILLR